MRTDHYLYLSIKNIAVVAKGMVFPVGYLRIGKGLIEREYGTKAGTVLPIL